MKIRSALFGCMIYATTMQASAQLAVGTIAPVFTTPAALAGKAFTFSLSDVLKQGPVVVYFYPKAFTTGCTIEANLFAEATEQFSKYKATVIGVSADDMDTLLKFSNGPCGGKFAVASDLNHRIIKSYKAAHQVRPDMADRISYVLAPDQKIIALISSTNPDQHVNKSLQAIQTWHDQSTKK